MDLPDEIIEEIVSHLEITDLYNYSRTCKLAYTLSREKLDTSRQEYLTQIAGLSKIVNGVYNLENSNYGVYAAYYICLDTEYSYLKINMNRRHTKVKMNAYTRKVINMPYFKVMNKHGTGYDYLLYKEKTAPDFLVMAKLLYRFLNCMGEDIDKFIREENTLDLLQ